MKERLPCVYMLASGFYGTLYVGVTSNLIGRLQQHRDELTGGFTSEYEVKCPVWYEVADSMEAAIAHEKRSKRWRREWKIALIERGNPQWADLAVDSGLSPLPSCI